jgi:allantoinase
MVVFDPEAAWTVTAAELHYRHAVSPYIGQYLRGKVLMTFLRGECAYKEGTFPGELHGREYTRTSFVTHHN